MTAPQLSQFLQAPSVVLRRSPRPGAPLGRHGGRAHAATRWPSTGQGGRQAGRRGPRDDGDRHPMIGRHNYKVPPTPWPVAGGVREGCRAGTAAGRKRSGETRRRETKALNFRQRSQASVPEDARRLGFCQCLRSWMLCRSHSNEGPAGDIGMGALHIHRHGCPAQATRVGALYVLLAWGRGHRHGCHIEPTGMGSQQRPHAQVPCRGRRNGCPVEATGMGAL